MNTTWHTVVSFPLETNLLPLLSQLKKRGISCHVTEEKGRQRLWVGEKDRIAEATQLSKQLNSDYLNLVQDNTEKQTRGDFLIVYLLRFSPVSVLTILLGLIGAILVELDTRALSYTHIFLFQPLANETLLPLSSAMESHQYWRLLTPIFLHFGAFHILFNGAILWSMGTRIERAKGSFYYLALIIVMGIISNIAQYLSQPNAIFGGLSGVVYGVIGYIAVYQRFIPHPLLQFNRAMILFFICWLALGFTGVVDLFITGKVANMSHLAGLIAGAIIGYIAVLKDKHQHIYWP